MKRILAYRKTLIFGTLLCALTIILVAKRNADVPAFVTTTVSVGDVAEVISVSGVMSAENEATLAFPVSGTVSNIFVKEGDIVSEGQILATLDQAELLADKQSAFADLAIAEANLAEANLGPRAEARSVTTTTISIAEANLARITAEEDEKVKNAYRTLLSTDLEALPLDKDTDDIPPIVSGTYTCEKEGSYTLSVYRSGASSGHSYKLSGLESGTYTAYTEAPSQFGTCGLLIQFADGELYSTSDWTILIPNTRSARYITNLNAYELAKEQAKNAIAAAKEVYDKAKAEGVLENAPPRREATDRLEAEVAQANARLAAIEARLEDHTLRAPFTGVVSALEMVPGEIAPQNAVTIVADTRYELTVRIPEIDITTIDLGQKAEIIFDAKQDETLSGTIDFISETATEIDGVAYFEAKIYFDTPPDWFRSGLNADVNIVVESRTEVLKIPKRFITTDEAGASSVLVPVNDKEVRQLPIVVTFEGNDGFAAIEGILSGTTIISP